MKLNSVAGPEFHDAPGQSAQHLLAVLSLAQPLLALAHAVEHPGEDRVFDSGQRARVTLTRTAAAMVVQS